MSDHQGSSALPEGPPPAPRAQTPPARPPVSRDATTPADATSTGSSATDFDAIHKGTTNGRIPVTPPPVRESRSELRARLRDEHRGPREARLRVRMVSIPSVIGYASLWMVFLLASFILTVFLLHMGLETTGVLASVSEAAATLLGQDLPASGLLPYAEQEFVLRTALLVGAALSVLGLLFAVTIALAHNVISWMTGGLRFTFRE